MFQSFQIDVYHYVYKFSAIDDFSEKLIGFHDECVDGLVMTGVGNAGESIETVKMVRMGHEMKLLKRIIGGFINTPGLFHIVAEDSVGDKYTECLITYLLDDDVVEDFYMLQAIHNYPNDGKILYSIWRLKLVVPSYINNYWRA